jgi:hypothetical protein
MGCDAQEAEMFGRVGSLLDLRSQYHFGATIWRFIIVRNTSCCGFSLKRHKWYTN